MASNDSPVRIHALVTSMKEKLKKSSPSYGDDHCIYRVNQKLKKIHPDAYNPEMVSIGPFHHKQGSLSAMEEHKLHCLKTFLERTKGNDLQDYIQHMLNLLDETRKCYAESIKLDNNAFVEMMLLDGLFIIDLFQKYWKLKNDRVLRHKDRLLNNSWSIASLKRDILLLENQLPMRVLDDLFNFTKTTYAAVPINNDDRIFRSVTELSLQFLDGLIMVKSYDHSSYQGLEAKHLLDLLGKTLHPSPSSPDPPSTLEYYRTATTSKSGWCVTELTQAGVKFKKRLSTDRLLDIKFNNGIMEIPPIVIDDLTDTLLRNLIAYEQCSHERVTYMISYAFFMDGLINSEEDVGILCEEGIIENNLGNNKEVCDLFNRLCNQTTLENFYYSDIYYRVDKYYKSNLNKWIAILKRDYFQTPWAIISVVAAVILLSLTIIQTVNSFN